MDVVWPSKRGAKTENLPPLSSELRGVCGSGFRPLFSGEGTRARRGSPAGAMPIAGVIFSFTNGIIYNLDRGSFDLTGGSSTSWPASLFGQAKYAKTIMKSFPGHKFGSLQEGQGLVMWHTHKRLK